MICDFRRIPKKSCTPEFEKVQCCALNVGTCVRYTMAYYIYICKYVNIVGHGYGSRTIAPEENCPPTPKLTLIQTITLTGGHFSSYETVWLPPNSKTNPNLDPSPNANRKAVFLGGQLSGYPWLYNLACGINSKSSEMQSNIMPKNDNNNTKTVLLLFITVVSLLISLNSSNILLLMLVSWSLNR